ncbi:cytoplasmic tRNA 2-thiolation protein 1 [Nematocida major]|uniref:cytoplasmic tRNA 2-thiolation protein 1 n=1 Tax=Nematocida major TaxID=1912982 RepID=UPI0020089A6E|nr:cytoplasmic tRNA 2-thiolation protein 1 [Nematocida major]KAH9385696.1 cytoplasmic tRNA 2-thiolation protein 1 [Nematocida major]
MGCNTCGIRPAVTIRPSNKMKLCKECFLLAIENQVHLTIQKTEMFKGVRKLVVGVSGGKDSTVLAHIINLLNKRHGYGIDLRLLCIDEGISGYRDKSIEVVHMNEKDLAIPLKIISYDEMYGHTMDSVVSKIGRKNNCTYCGVFRRGALEDGTRHLGGDMIATGHNADDIAETVLLNYFRGDLNRLVKCTHPVTQVNSSEVVPRCKPLSEVYEKEIVMYAFYNKLPYFSTECKYSPGAFRGFARTYIKALEKTNPQVILKIIESGNHVQKAAHTMKSHICRACGKTCSSAEKTCKSCLLLKTLEAPECP